MREAEQSDILDRSFDSYTSSIPMNNTVESNLESFVNEFLQDLFHPNNEDDDDDVYSEVPASNQSIVIEIPEKESLSPKKKVYFSISKLTTEEKTGSSHHVNLFITRKRMAPGQKRQNFEFEQRKHDRNSKDNVLRKLQVAYLDFIVDATNRIIYSIFGKNSKRLLFSYLDYGFKKIVNKRRLKELKSKTIGELLALDISCKYKTKDKKSNKKIYDSLKNYKFLERFFNARYLDLFTEFYENPERKLNLHRFGLPYEICLPSKVSLYDDLLRRTKSENIYSFYRKKLEECICLNFLPNLIKMKI